MKLVGSWKIKQSQDGNWKRSKTFFKGNAIIVRLESFFDDKSTKEFNSFKPWEIKKSRSWKTQQKRFQGRRPYQNGSNFFPQ